MNPEDGPLPPGLYLVATPIGNARDLTLRAADILRQADILAAEDTRSLRKLMEIHGISLNGRPMIAYHDHNGAKARPRILGALKDGRSVAYASEAGTPLVSDPGYDLVGAARDAGHAVTSAPGASAVLAALTVAGLPTDRFLFAGFLPAAGGPRRAALAELAAVPATLVFYESPRRLGAMLAAAAGALGPGRPAAVARELTKRFEEVRRGTLAELAETYASEEARGEVVVLVGRGSSEKISDSDLDLSLREALRTMSVRDAADFVSRMHGMQRRKVYQRAMRLDAATREGDGDLGDDADDGPDDDG
ncbi:16S rRNA (cytidine(1402)-2'-O)-methyltransferase [Roseivivax isoporae]|uniref:Ribosomal RNA small subunit methyltransferase I n=1 Tax=Roseivivax isoporae LMG 25204 TaxID=1449351 RepID=X7FDW0_9RHOB|nr:16S rRNA (cytidine(1402)-2'-O)-methyltransferase [Roseivivax isoporae]ETX30948.1 16S rRNA methyltransferase [Roseivivax isoporae LMG 25204]